MTDSKRLVVTGSLAFDRIAVFHDRFANHILPDKVHRLNVSFMVPDMAQHHGGTAGNIAYSLALLGEKPVVVGAVGSDATSYLEALSALGADMSHVRAFSDSLTANATILTDLEDNQITAFCMGAMRHAPEVGLEEVKEPIAYVIIAPNAPQAMMLHRRYCHEKGIPFIADPGQRIPKLSDDELRELADGAELLVLNDYEWEMMQRRTGYSPADFLEHAKAVIVTYGEKGSALLRKGMDEERVPAYLAAKLVDPTGCGDAYRAGLLYGLSQGFELGKAARIGSWVAGKAMESQGTQSHQLNLNELKGFIDSL